MNKNDLLGSIPQQSYIAVLLDTSSSLEHPPSKIPIATRTTPEQLCGKARRIGYTTPYNDALALYRIKTRTDHRSSYVTLPSIFVLAEGVFVDYQQWFSSDRV